MKISIKRLLNISLATGLLWMSSCKDDDGDSTPATNTSNFCYNYAGSNLNYDSIQGGNFLTAANNDGFYEIDLGFQFNMCDRSFSTLFIEQDYLTTTFTYDLSQGTTDLRKYYIVAHGDLDLESKWDNGSSSYISKIVTTTSGTPGNLRTTIEFRDFEYYDFSANSAYYTVNYKMIFAEADNSVSYHYGPNDLTLNFSDDPFNQFIVGLYSDNEQDGLFLDGNPSSPTTKKNGFRSQLNTWPSANTVYKFTKK